MENGQRDQNEALLSGARSIGVELGQRELGLLLRYAELVREWNQRINLVSRKDIGNLVSSHIVDSLAGVPVLKRLIGGDQENKAVSLEGQARSRTRDDTAPAHPPLVMDLGSGGGLPGIPLKICLPDVEMALVESTKKKARFLETAVGELGLPGVTVVDRHSRELEKDPRHRGKYDLVTARAVAELNDLVMLAFPFLKTGGRLIAYKGAKTGEETAGARGMLKRIGGVVEECHGQSAGDTDKTRYIVVVRRSG